MPDISSVEVKAEPVEKITSTIVSNLPAASTPMVIQQHILGQGVQKTIMTTASLEQANKTQTIKTTAVKNPTVKTPTVKTPTVKTTIAKTPVTKTVPAMKMETLDVNKSILGKSKCQKAVVAPKNVKTPKVVKDPVLSAVRRIVDTPVSVGSVVRRIPDNPVPILQSVVRKIPESARVKKEMSLLDPSVSNAAVCHIHLSVNFKLLCIDFLARSTVLTKSFVLSSLVSTWEFPVRLII